MAAPILMPWDGSAGRTQVCFRYVIKGHAARAYDVLVVFKGDERACDIDIRHAVANLDDLPPLTCGLLSAKRLRATVDLLELVQQLTSKDRTANRSGALVYGGHLSFPFDKSETGPASPGQSEASRCQARARASHGTGKGWPKSKAAWWLRR
ncbi:hypothetical protein AWB68_08541 [Caballeronia choica]|jgi:hypothetical protein|uniref:Uncharacterized protein n=1 Tax=Caballeronia choica TaxID=326476 RepID=A0A158L4B3_9BURK|nr:hypothetical protein [Caballeronia choica]SAL87793.1 hypothetical protein AWB68_08541 [Caballeronia choica]